MATWRRRGGTSNTYHNTDYRAVPAHEYDDDDALIDTQFSPPPVKVPWSALLLAAILCFGGATLLCLGCLLSIGYIDPKYVDRTWPLLVLGSVMFVPGVYHVRIAYFAFLNRPGYSFDDIPAFD